MSSLGKSLTTGETYDYDSPYFPQYRPATTTERYFMGRRWVQHTQLGPWTRYIDGRMVITQGRHVSTWTFDNAGAFAAVRHTSREVNAPRHPQR